jgi:hypothetical protein
MRSVGFHHHEPTPTPPRRGLAFRERKHSFYPESKGVGCLKKIFLLKDSFGSLAVSFSGKGPYFFFFGGVACF